MGGRGFEPFKEFCFGSLLVRTEPMAYTLDSEAPFPAKLPVPGFFGDVAQLGEHRLCKPGVGGSSPLVSTS